MNRNEKVKILSQFLAGQPSRLLQLKRLAQSANNEFAHLSDEELDRQAAQLEARFADNGIAKTAEIIALDEQIAELKLLIAAY